MCINIQKRVAMLIIVGTLSMSSACGVSRQQDDPAINAVQFQNALTVTPEQAESLELPDADLSEMSSISEQKGSFTGEAAEQLLSEQEELLRGYMEAYYRGLTELQAQNLSSLFLENAAEQVLMNESAAAYVTGLREMQDADLHLADYQYELNVTLVQETGDTTEVQLTETSTQNFAQSPDIDSMLYNIRHVFLMTETEEGWKIAEHWQRDNIYRNLLGRYWSWEERSLTMEDPDTYFPEQVETLLSEAWQEKLQRTGRNQTADLAVDYPYQREAAVLYSDIWVGQRNTEWSDFTGRGGNCQNFVSQCLLAGGIPMDDQGDVVWSWDSEGNHSASWVGVDEFYRYASQNSGYGLLAEVEWEYAARGGTTTIFNVGDQVHSDLVNFEGSYPYLIEENYVSRRDPDVVTSRNRGGRRSQWASFRQMALDFTTQREMSLSGYLITMATTIWKTQPIRQEYRAVPCG